MAACFCVLKVMTSQYWSITTNNIKKNYQNLSVDATRWRVIRERRSTCSVYILCRGLFNDRKKKLVKITSVKLTFVLYLQQRKLNNRASQLEEVL